MCVSHRECRENGRNHIRDGAIWRQGARTHFCDTPYAQPQRLDSSGSSETSRIHTGSNTPAGDVWDTPHAETPFLNRLERRKRTKTGRGKKEDKGGTRRRREEEEGDEEEKVIVSREECRTK